MQKCVILGLVYLGRFSSNFWTFYVLTPVLPTMVGSEGGSHVARVIFLRVDKALAPGRMAEMIKYIKILQK